MIAIFILHAKEPMRAACRESRSKPSIMRSPSRDDWGAGPRACQHLIIGSKVRALLRGRTHVTLDDVLALAPPVLRHRLVPTFNAEAEGVTVEHIIDHLIEATPTGEPARVV